MIDTIANVAAIPAAATISNDAALAMIAAGHAALSANLAEPIPPKPVPPVGEPKPPVGVQITDGTALLKAIESAKGGEVLLLAPGDYGRVAFRDVTFDIPVTIRSSNPAEPAVLTGLTVIGCAGLTFRELRLDYSKPWAVWNTQITNSRNIELRDLHAHGSVNGDPGDDQNAVLIRNSTDIKVIGCEFYEFAHAVSTMGGSDVEIRGNSFHDLRSDGVMCAGTSRAQVLGNAFTDFHPAEGDHPDAIQFLTRGTTGKAQDILVSGNLIVRGGGDIIQGVFITDQIGVGYNRVIVTDNVVIGGMYNGVMVSGAADAVIDGNRVVGYADQKSWIRLNGVASGRLTDNAAMSYVMGDGVSVQKGDNRTIAAIAAADVPAWLVSNAPKAVADLYAVLGKAPARVSAAS